MITKHEQAFEFLATGDHVLIIYSALKKLGMRPSDDDYNDYVQDCWLWFSEIFQKYSGNPWSQPKSFLAYAHVALYRRALNERMRVQKRDKVTDDAPDWEQVGEELALLTTETDIVDRSMLDSWLGKCSGVEREYLIDAVVHQMTPTEIAEKRGVSRQTVYQWRRKVREKLKQLRV